MTTKLPKSVQAQLKAAEEAFDRAAAKPEGAASNPVGEPPEAKQPEQPAQESQVNPAAAEGTPPAQPVQDTPQPPKVSDWEQKYNVLQGKYNAEVPRMAQAVRELKQANDELAQKVKELQDSKPQAPVQTETFVNPDEIESYGADLLDVAARKAKEQYLPLIRQLEGKIQTLEQQLQQGNKRVENVEQATTRSLRDTFFAHLDAKVPAWEQLNTDPGFLSWLDSVDDLYGVSRRQMFNQAYERLDADRVARFFTAFAGPGTKPAPQQNGLAPVVPKDELVAPSNTRGPTAPPTQQKSFSRAEIQTFYDRLRQGAYRGREAEAKRIEAEIFRAQAEGRLVA